MDSDTKPVSVQGLGRWEAAYGIRRLGVQEGNGRQRDKGRGVGSSGWAGDNTGGQD